jgi:hypothetical protein
MAIAIVAGLAMAAMPAATASADDSSTMQNYSVVRDQLMQCNLDTDWNQLSSERKAECNDLFRDYVLVYQKDGPAYYIHCRSSARCIPTPEGDPDAAGPIPPNSTVYDVKPRTTARERAKAAAHKRHRHHRR